MPKVILKTGVRCAFCLLSVTLRCGFVSTDKEGCFRLFATAWVVYEFVWNSRCLVSHFRFALVEVLLFSAFLRAASQSAFR